MRWPRAMRFFLYVLSAYRAVNLCRRHDELPCAPIARKPRWTRLFNKLSARQMRSSSGVILSRAYEIPTGAGYESAFILKGLRTAFGML
jgi:hypothetical protein